MTSLNKPVLVLNKVWMPIRVITVMRSIKLLFANKASAVNTDDYSIYKWDDWAKQEIFNGDSYISAVNNNIKVPEVIVLAKYDKVYRKDVKLTKRNIYIRDEYKCQYSGKRIKESEADIDHIIPRSKGGENVWENLVVCSKEINRKKGYRTPEQAGLKLIKKPTKPDNSRILIDPRMNIPKSWEKFIKKK